MADFIAEGLAGSSLETTNPRFGIGRSMSNKEQDGGTPGLGYPDGKTRIVGQSLILFVAVCVAGFFVAIIPAANQTSWWVLKGDIQQAVLATLAAGIGSGIATIMAYLRHACERRDFRDDYVPWYVFRPLMGMLLGLVFYFILKGGLMATVQTQKPLELNHWAVAGVSALVGMFSKDAIEKLREVFRTLFQTADQPPTPPVPDDQQATK